MLAGVLRGATRLRMLCMTDSTLFNTGKDTSEGLIAALGQCTSLERLYMAGTTRGSAGLHRAVVSLANLRELDVGGWDTDASDFGALLDGLQHLTALQTLHIGQREYDDNTAARLARSLRLCPSLTSVSLDSITPCGDAWMWICSALSHVSKLRSLAIQGMPPRPVPDHHGVDLFASISALTGLHIDWNDEAANTIEASIAVTPPPGLTSLSVYVTEYPTPLLCGAVKRMTSLRKLHVKGRSDGRVPYYAPHAGPWLQALQTMTQLTSLHISGFQLFDTTRDRVLCRVLPNLRQLETLELVYCSFADDQDARYLLSSIASMSRLRILDLSFCKLTHTTALYLAGAAPIVCPSLRVVDLTDTVSHRVWSCRARVSFNTPTTQVIL